MRIDVEEPASGCHAASVGTFITREGQQDHVRIDFPQAVHGFIQISTFCITRSQMSGVIRDRHELDEEHQLAAAVCLVYNNTNL